MCTSCAWAKPAEPHPFEFCENGAKATIWELTRDRCGPEFFADHTARRAARLDRPRPREAGPAHPSPALRPRDRPLRRDHLGGGLRRDRRRAARGSTRSPPSSTPRAGRASRPPTSTRSSRRLYGTQQPARQLEHVPRDDERRAEEGHRRRRSGTCMLDGLRACRLHPVLRPEHRAPTARACCTRCRRRRSRGCRIVAFNPLRERGLGEFINPQNPAEMLTGRETRISDIYLQVQARRRHRGHHGHLQASLLELRRTPGAACSTAASSPSTPTASRPSRRRRAASRWEEIERRAASPRAT